MKYEIFTPATSGHGLLLLLSLCMFDMFTDGRCWDTNANNFLLRMRSRGHHGLPVQVSSSHRLSHLVKKVYKMTKPFGMTLWLMALFNGFIASALAYRQQQAAGIVHEKLMGEFARPKGSPKEEEEHDDH